MTTYFTLTGAELREATGEGFNTIAKNGALTIAGSPAKLVVDGNEVEIVRTAREPFKRIGRDFKIATNDLMSSYYISLPSGLQDAVYDRFEELLGLMAEGKPLTLPGPAAKAAAAVAAAAPKAQEAAVVAKSAATDAAAAAKGAATSAAAATEKMASEAAAGASEAAAAASKAAAGFFEQLKELGAKAAQDTMAMAQAIKDKAEHDMASLQEKKPAAGGGAA